MLRAGIVGAGVFGSFHADKYHNSPNVDLCSVFDTSPNRAEKLAEAFNANVYADYDDFLGSVDILTIAAPADVHFSLGRRAIELGKHVYMEKPLAINVRHAELLNNMASENDVVLQVGHQERIVIDSLGIFRPDSSLKKLEFCRCGPPSGRGEEVSVVFDLMIHDLDIASYLGCGELMDVHACGTAHDIAATLEFDRGVSASFLSSRRSNERHRSMRAIYDDGEIELDFINRRYESTRPDDVGKNFETDKMLDPLSESVSAFVEAVRSGSSVRIPAADAVRAVDLASHVETAYIKLANGSKSFVEANLAERMTA
ncbi:MAG: Gfo/Idh/MocA family oxidoreductase [Pseudomonadota bacterium]